MPTSFTEHDGDRNITALIQMEIRYIETQANVSRNSMIVMVKVELI